MCILFIHVDPDPSEGGYRLIAASNRDEYYKRPAQAATRCPTTDVIGGRDLEPGREGGMWLGFRSKPSENGKEKVHCLAVLTNITGEKRENAGGRGVIVADYLETKSNFPEYIQQLKAKDITFNGFNLMAVELRNQGVLTYHYSNTPEIYSIYTGKQTLGFGNSPPFSPLTKVVNSRNVFAEIVEQSLDREELKHKLIELLKNRKKHLPDEELKKRSPAYEYLCSNFIQLEEAGYGTRTHTLILIDKEWNLEFIEHTLREPIDIKNPVWDVNVIKSRL